MAQLLCLSLFVSAVTALTANTEFAVTPITYITRQSRLRIFARDNGATQDSNTTTLFPAYNISVPVDHFPNSSRYEPHRSESFPLRYWFDASDYEPGGPVIVLQGGETDGEGRLPFLQKGLLAQLSKATRGIGVVLEHRYYGTSFPVEDLSTENLRFLTTEQALADEVYFAQHVVFKGLEDFDLTAPNTAYLGYGGSYAGGFNAFLRTQYPDIFWGTIASSGVTEAIWDLWQYFEPIRIYGPSECISTIQTFVDMTDNILKSNDTADIRMLKDVFGLQGITYDIDFVNLLSYPLGGWQGRNWDPEENDPSFMEYCGNISSSATLFPGTINLTNAVQKLLSAGGYGDQQETLTARMLNWIGNMKSTILQSCVDKSADECYLVPNATYYAQDDISQTWRSWPYQYCTEWGYLQTGSGVPEGQLPLISRLLDLEYYSTVCRQAFNITDPPDLERVNKYGGFDISYPRLALIDGEQDPWRVATPHASPFNATARNRTSTTCQPFLLIEGGVHHWDENGVFPNETRPGFPPAPVAEVQRAEVQFVLEWMEDWKLNRSNTRACSAGSTASLELLR